jgi:hypothetical protein
MKQLGHSGSGFCWQAAQAHIIANCKMRGLFLLRAAAGGTGSASATMSKRIISL